MDRNAAGTGEFAYSGRYFSESRNHYWHLVLINGQDLGLLVGLVRYSMLLVNGFKTFVRCNMFVTLLSDARLLAMAKYDNPNVLLIRS